MRRGRLSSLRPNQAAHTKRWAMPLPQQETLQAQSANIDSVSGATVTSDGYKESLQAALNAAHLQ